MKQLDELAQIQKTRMGNLEAFNQIVLEYQSFVYNHAVWLVRDTELAADLTQDTFIKAYQCLNRYRGGSLRSWLLRIVTNACLDELRRRKRRKIHSLTSVNQYDEEHEREEWLKDPDRSVEEKIEQKEFRGNLQKYISELPEEYRLILVLVDVCEMEYGEVAHFLNIPIGTVKSRLSRARWQMRDKLESSSWLPQRQALAST